MPRVLPYSTADNRLIMTKQRWSGQGQLALMVDRIPELKTDAPAVSEQPLQNVLFDASTRPQRQYREAIIDQGLAHLLAAY